MYVEPPEYFSSRCRTMKALPPNCLRCRIMRYLPPLRCQIMRSIRRIIFIDPKDLFLSKESVHQIFLRKYKSLSTRFFRGNIYITTSWNSIYFFINWDEFLYNGFLDCNCNNWLFYHKKDSSRNIQISYVNSTCRKSREKAHSQNKFSV